MKATIAKLKNVDKNGYITFLFENEKKLANYLKVNDALGNNFEVLKTVEIEITKEKFNDLVKETIEPFDLDENEVMNKIEDMGSASCFCYKINGVFYVEEGYTTMSFTTLDSLKRHFRNILK